MIKKICPYCHRLGQLGIPCESCGYILRESDKSPQTSNTKENGSPHINFSFNIHPGTAHFTSSTTVINTTTTTSSSTATNKTTTSSKTTTSNKSTAPSKNPTTNRTTSASQTATSNTTVTSPSKSAARQKRLESIICIMLSIPLLLYSAYGFYMTFKLHWGKSLLNWLICILVVFEITLLGLAAYRTGRRKSFQTPFWKHTKLILILIPILVILIVFVYIFVFAN